MNPRPPPNPYQPPGRGLAKGTSGEGRVFGVPIEQSLRYAGVAISTMGPCVFLFFCLSLESVRK